MMRLCTLMQILVKYSPRMKEAMYQVLYPIIPVAAIFVINDKATHATPIGSYAMPLGTPAVNNGKLP